MAKNNTLKIVGISCAVLFFIGGCILAALFYFGYQQAQNLKEGIENPEPKAMEILGMETVPDGYFVNMAISIPFLTDTVMLSDEPNAEGQGPDFRGGRNGFFYTLVKVVKEKDQEKLDDFFSGNSDDMSALKENNINVDFSKDDVLGRGVLDINNMSVRYFTAKGGVNTDHVTSDGLTNVMLFTCEGTNKLRFGIWFTSEQGITNDDGTMDLTGTVADENRIREFLGHFNLCPSTN